MKHQTLLFVAALSLPLVVDAQSEITVSKQEFVDSQINMLQQMKQVQADMNTNTDQMMKQRLSPEAYAEYKDEVARQQQEQEQKMANCLGLPKEDVAGLTEKVGPEFQIDVVQQCSGKLPNSIAMESLDWTTNPELAGYQQCVEGMVAQKIGVEPSKFNECTQMAEDF